MPSVSVIIPTYNCARYVSQAVDSVLAQTRPADQIIVIDDGSTDDTAERLAPYRNRILFLQQPNQGVSAARNHGITHVTGDFIAFLDSDDIWHPRKLEFHLAAMQESPNIGMMGTTTFDWPNVQPSAELKPEKTSLTAIPWEKLVIKNYFTTSSVIVRREMLEKAGKFDRALQGPEDYDLWLRLAEITTVANLSLPLTGYRATMTGLGNQARKMESGLSRILDKLLQRPYWQSQGTWLRRRKAYSFFRVTCAIMYAAAGEHWAAARRLVMSMGGYPLPFGIGDAKTSFLRPKMLGILLLRALRIKSQIARSSTASHVELISAQETP